MLTPDQKAMFWVSQSLREISSSMEGTGKNMQCVDDNVNMVMHGREMEEAAAIAAAWAYEIEQEYGLKSPEDTPVMSLDYTKAMKITWGGLGDKVMNFIIESGLLSTECPDAPESGCVTVWAANAAEQIEACIADLARQGTVPCPLCEQSQ